MDAPESPVNRIGRTIWTVWGYLSGAVARYLRPEVTDEGNQRACSRSDPIDLNAANKINREVKANSSEKEDNKSSYNDKSTGEVKCSLAQVKVQVASVQWEKTDVVKDDKNDELNVDAARKQTYSCAMWSAGTDHEGSISGDSESRECKSGTLVEKEAVSSDEVQDGRVYANSKDSEIVQELDETGRIEQKDDNNEEYDQKYEENPDNGDVTVQSEPYGQDVEQEKEIMMDHGETESSGGFVDEIKKETVGLKERVETEIDEDPGPELQVPGDAFEEEADVLSNPEKLKVIEKYYDEIAEFCKNEVEEMIPENRDATESEQDTVKSKLQESAETLQTVSEEKTGLNIETELKMTVNASEVSLQFDLKQDTPENIIETGTGLPVVMAMKTEGMFSYPIECEFPGESRKRPETALGCFEEIKSEPQSLAEEQRKKDTFVARSVEHPETPKAVEEAVEIEPPIETIGAIESPTHQEIDDTKFSLKKHVEFKTELIDATTEIKISSEDEEAEPFETQSQSSNFRNVTLQTRELLEFTERERKSSQEAMDTFSESLGNVGVSEISGTAEIRHVAEDQTDTKPVLIQTLSPAEFLEETLDLQGKSEQCIEEQETRDTDVAKIALVYVEEITNQVLKEMIEMENNLVKETETLEGDSTEELGDAGYQGPEECVSVGAFVLEEERKLLGETMGSIMEVETTSREVAVQNEQDIISQECKTTEADQQSYLCAGTDHEGSGSLDTESETQEVSSDEVQDERVYANSKDSEIVQELDETGQIEEKDGNNEEYDQKYEEDPDNADVTVQSEPYGQDVEREKPIMMDHGETERSGGFELEGFIDEMEKETVGLKERVETEIDEDPEPELQVPGDAFEEEANGLSNPERLKVMEKHCDEIAEFCKNEVEEMIPENRGATKSEQVTIKLQQSWDTESDTHVENEEVSSDEVQAENSKDSEIVQELDETGRIEQKDDNNEEYDQKYEDENCSKKSEDPDHADVTVQSEFYGQDVEQEKEILMDHGETESSGGFVDEMEKETVGLKERVETEIDEDQGPELQVPGDAFEEKADGLSNPERLKVMEKHCDEIAEVCINEVEEMIPENRGATESEQDIIKSPESWDTESDTLVENEEVSSSESQAERGHADIECKESETALELDKTGQIEPKDENDEDRDQNHEDEKCEMKSEDPDVTVQSELYRQEQEKEIMMDHGETESSGGFRHLIDENEQNIVDQKDHEKAEIDEDQEPADAFVLEEGRKLFGETMEVENASRGAVKHIEPQSSPECETNEADGRHDQILESSGHEDFMEVSRPGMKRGFDRVNKDPPVVKIEGTFDLDPQAFEDSSLDFSVQKSRIAVKNPLVRPPKDPRKLLFKISVEPRLPQPPACEVSAPSKGVIGFKLPGLGAGLPALRKTEFGKKAREEGEAEGALHPQLKSVAVTEDSVKREPASAKPKWTPPKHPGMGSPLMMAELRNKLKKPVKE